MSRNLAQNTIPLVKLQKALQTFLNTLGSPGTAKIYQGAVRKAIGVEYMADVTAFGLGQYCRGFVLLRGALW